jgi:hypothetical protein
MRSRLSFPSPRTYRADKFHIKDGTIEGVGVTCTSVNERARANNSGGRENSTSQRESNKIYFSGDAVVLATGHSARDVYYELHESGVKLEAKGFAVGFRVEHPQVRSLTGVHVFRCYFSLPHHVTLEISSICCFSRKIISV